MVVCIKIATWMANPRTSVSVTDALTQMHCPQSTVDKANFSVEECTHVFKIAVTERDELINEV